MFSNQIEAFCCDFRQVDIMEDQGSYGDRNAGFGSTDGQWHHIAATWESSTGIATLYLDGRKVNHPLCLASLSASPLILMPSCHPATEALASLPSQHLCWHDTHGVTEHQQHYHVG